MVNVSCTHCFRFERHGCQAIGPLKTEHTGKERGLLILGASTLEDLLAKLHDIPILHIITFYCSWKIKKIAASFYAPCFNLRDFV